MIAPRAAAMSSPRVEAVAKAAWMCVQSSFAQQP